MFNRTYKIKLDLNQANKISSEHHHISQNLELSFSLRFPQRLTNL